jgi:16S rRNA (cytosine967-C5)-methyltransferase
VALGVLVRVERDRAFADLALAAALRDSKLERRDRALATELTYGTLRLRGRIDAALAQVTDRELESVELGVRNLLRLGAYQLMFLSRMRDSAAVDETVNLARALGMARAAGFVNAVLRKLAETKGRLTYPVLEQDPVGHLEAVGSLPRWLAERLVAELGVAEAVEFARTQLHPAPRTIRVSPGFDKHAIARRLRARACTYAPDGLTNIQSDPLRDAGFARGEFTLQDEASQLVTLLLGAQPGDTVVDCCAAPGTKTVQLAQQVGRGGEVIALELHEARLALIRHGTRRLGLANVRSLQRDAIQGFDLRGKLRFPRILVDAPCSGLGVLRRNPDARWRLEPDDILRCAEIQTRLLDSAARYVEPKGVLVYSVCTMTHEETTGVIARFLDTHTDFHLDDPRPHLPPAAKELVDDSGALRTLPHKHGCDGFYAVRLVRS